MKSLFPKARLFALAILLMTGIFGASADTVTIGDCVYRTYTEDNSHLAELLGFKDETDPNSESTYDGKVLVTSFTIDNSIETFICGTTHDILITNKIVSVAPDAFKGQYAMKHLQISSNIKDIADNTLGECTNLLKVTSASGTLNGDGSGTALYRIEASWPKNKLNDLLWISGGLEEFTIPAEVSHVSSSAFSSCSSMLKSITLDPENPYLVVKDGVIYNKETDEIQACMPLVSEVIIQAGTKKLPDYFMYGAAFSGVTKVVLPEGLEEIGKYAFAGCPQLKEISIPASVTSIGDYAFSGSGIENIVFQGNSLSSVGNYAFAQCPQLKNITVPANGVSIGDFAFSGSGIENIVFQGNSLSSVGNYAFARCPQLKEIKFPASVTSIGDFAFLESGIESAVLPQEANQLGRGMFRDCKALQSVKLPLNTSVLPDETFYGCQALKSFTIPQNITTLGEKVFMNTNIKEVTMHDAVVAAGASTFENTPNLTNVVLSASLTRIPDRMFVNSGISEIAIPSGIREIGNYVFRNAPRLKAINLGPTLNRIGEYAFAGTPLESVTGGERLLTIGEYAFYQCHELKDISLPDFCKLSAYAFAESGLTSFRLPSVNTAVPEGLLRDTPITSIVISPRCTQLGYVCFYTPTLRQVYCNAESCPNAYVSFHKDTFDYGTLTVPTGKKTEYYIDEFWGRFKNIEANDSGVEDVSGDEEGVQISVAGGELTVSGCASVEVYAANGLRVYAGTPDSIGSLSAGLYIVRAGGRTAKVRL